MAVASKSAVSARKRIPSKARRSRAVAELNPEAIPLSLKAKDLPSRPKASSQAVLIQSTRSTPMWLLSLYALQRPSSVVMFLLVATMLSVYSWTVYSQKMWSQAHRNLEILQRHERQLTTTGEVLKNKMAFEAEQPVTNLVLPNPATAIFLPVAPQRPDHTADSVLPPTKAATKTKQPSLIPLGY